MTNIESSKEACHPLLSLLDTRAILSACIIARSLRWSSKSDLSSGLQALAFIWFDIVCVIHDGSSLDTCNDLHSVCLIVSLAGKVLSWPTLPPKPMLWLRRRMLAFDGSCPSCTAPGRRRRWPRAPVPCPVCPVFDPALETWQWHLRVEPQKLAFPR